MRHHHPMLRPQNLNTEECRPEQYASLGFSTICLYIQNQSEACEGGGYLLWTEYAFCAESAPLRALVVAASVAFFCLLFLHLSTTADSFFCKNIAAIVDIHQISQNIAGITFMAFGNGAPDIFSSIASVISVKQPRADLAISELLGGGIFVTTCVIAAIALTRPFHLMRRPILRDICFFLLALALLVFVTFTSTEMHFWQPLAFLFLYLVYAVFVVSSNRFRQRMRVTVRRHRMRKAIARFSAMVPPKKCCKVAAIGTPNSRGDDTVKGKDIDDGGEKARTASGIEKGPPSKSSIVVKTPSVCVEGIGGNAKRRIVSVVESTLGIPIEQYLSRNTADDELRRRDRRFSADDFLEAGKFFAKEELDDEEEEDDDDDVIGNPVDCATGNDEMGTKRNGGEHNDMQQTTTTTATTIACVITSSNVNNNPPPPTTTTIPDNNSYRKEVRRLLQGLTPLDWNKFRSAGWPLRLYLIAKMPSMLLLRLTVPNASRPWSKSVAALHAFMAPLVFCIAFQWFQVPIGPLAVGEVALVVSLVFSLLVIVFTNLDREPPSYRRVSAYMGFCVSIAWIYATAAEVMDVVLALGTLSGISPQILGLTAIAWSNSIGDLVADVSVARQGMSRMAFSAAIGAPLFNLMVGFGTTFTISELQGKVVLIRPNPVASVMFAFLGLSLLTTLVLLLVQRFHVRRFHGFVLLALYALFITLAILASQGILFSFIH